MLAGGHGGTQNEICRGVGRPSRLHTRGAGDYNRRSLAVLKPRGTFVHVMNQGWNKKHGNLVGMMLEVGAVMRGCAPCQQAHAHFGSNAPDRRWSLAVWTSIQRLAKAIGCIPACCTNTAELGHRCLLVFPV